MYVCQKDSALGISNWLFGGGGRLGKLKSDMFTPEELDALRIRKSVQIVDAHLRPGPASGTATSTPTPPSART